MFYCVRYFCVNQPFLPVAEDETFEVSEFLSKRNTLKMRWPASRYSTTYPIDLLASDWKEVCQRLATGWLFSKGTPVSPTNKTDRHDITEILLQLALNRVVLVILLLQTGMFTTKTKMIILLINFILFFWWCFQQYFSYIVAVSLLVE
jgi:hypothetical protein